MSKILIIGKGSFIGTNFIKSSRYKHIVEVDLKSMKPEELNLAGFDVIIHLAAIVHQTSKISLSEYQRVNCDLPVEVANKARNSGVKQFIFMSTSKVYGAGTDDNVVWTENSICNPTEGYGISKLNAENELLALISEDFDVSIIRTPLVYGPGVKANMLNLINLIDIVPILPLGFSLNRRSITYVENIVAFIDRIIELRISGLFIAKDTNSLSTKELSVFIANSLGKKRIIFNPGIFLLVLLKRLMPRFHERLYESFVLDNSQTLQKLNFTPPFSAEEGIKRTVDYYKKSIRI